MKLNASANCSRCEPFSFNASFLCPCRRGSSGSGIARTTGGVQLQQGAMPRRRGGRVSQREASGIVQTGKDNPEGAMQMSGFERQIWRCRSCYLERRNGKNNEDHQQVRAELRKTNGPRKRRSSKR